MTPIINFRGYTAPDPLDRAPEHMRFILTMLVGAVVATVFLYAGSSLYRTYEFEYRWIYWAGIAAYTFIAAPLLVILRKSSSVLLYLMIMLPCSLTDIFLQSYYRDKGLTAWWTYDAGTFLSPIPVPLKFFAAWSFDGVIQGVFVLWLSRMLANAIYPASKSKPEPTFEQRDALFPEEWTNEGVAKPQRDAGFWLLRLLGIGYLAYFLICLVGILGTSNWPAGAKMLIVMTYENPALGINTFCKISIMILLAFIGAYNRNVRWHCTLGLIVGHSMSTLASLSFYFYNPPQAPYRSFLLTSAIVDGAMVLIFAWILVRYRAYAQQFAPEKEFVDFSSLPDQLTRIFFYTLGTVMALMIPTVVLLRTLADGSTGLGAVYGYPDPQLCNTITRFSALSVLAFLLARRQKLRNYLTSVLIFAFSITLAGDFIWILFASITGGGGIRTRSGAVAMVDWYFLLQLALDGLAIALLTGLRKMYYNVDYVITALNPSSAQDVVALHEALYEGGPVENAAVLRKIDRHVAGIQGKKRGLLNFPFWIVEHLFSPLFGLHPTFSNMSRDEQRYFLRKSVLRPPRERARAFIPALAEFAYMIGTAVHAFVTFAHYTYIKGWEEVGYIPPDARDRLQGDYPSSQAPFTKVAALPTDHTARENNKPISPPPPRPLIAPRISTPVSEPVIPDAVDYLIIGSGAGGACMAYRLACEVSDPSQILVIDSGPRYSPLQDFNDDEMEMIRKLYKEGGLQQSKRYDLMVLQGECVGGTTVINNAVCLQMPRQVRDTWQNEYDIDLSGLDDERNRLGEYSRIGQEIEISEIPNAAINQRVKERFIKGVTAYNASIQQGAGLNPPEILSANQRNILGDGLCNLGNKRLRKRSMLETYIPWAEARGVKVTGGASAVYFTTDSSGRRAEAVLLQTSHGSLKKVSVRKAVIVAGGVIASSQFLMRSGIKKSVGHGMSCNFAFPVAFEFPNILDAFDGVQITMGAFDAQNRAAFETYFNPPGAFALSLPFYFNRSHDLMKRYRYLLNFGALVGSEPNGVIELRGDAMNGRPFTWELGDRDRENIKYAYGALLDIGMAAGATRAILPTEPGLEIPLTPDNISRFKQNLARYPLQMSDLRLATAHPQGGNRMAGDNSPHKEKRVVDADFRVDGFENVFVADASIFPTGITVNPQWTIMAMSSLAAKKILAFTETKVLAAKRR